MLKIIWKKTINITFNCCCFLSYTFVHYFYIFKILLCFFFFLFTTLFLCFSPIFTFHVSVFFLIFLRFCFCFRLLKQTQKKVTLRLHCPVLFSLPSFSFFYSVRPFFDFTFSLIYVSTRNNESILKYTLNASSKRHIDILVNRL